MKHWKKCEDFDRKKSTLLRHFKCVFETFYDIKLLNIVFKITFTARVNRLSFDNIAKS
jgi:hypothetical protein